MSYTETNVASVVYHLHSVATFYLQVLYSPGGQQRWMKKGHRKSDSCAEVSQYHMISQLYHLCVCGGVSVSVCRGVIFVFTFYAT